MKYTTLPNTTIQVSKIALGTMTFGEQNTEAEAHSQLDFALERDINFIDTAEMYPIAARKETLGKTEQYIGSWFKKSGKRDKVVLATKIAGPNRGLEYIRNPLDFSKKSITEAVHKSLTNLQTDYIDLYQLHWPERVMNMFGQRGISEVDSQWQDSIFEVLNTLDGVIKSGKIRHIGVSNENPWGVMKYIRESEKHNLPRIVSIQNPYSLLNRLFEIGLSEISMREKVGLLAYSPLGFGFLTGKYLTGTDPNSRIGLFPQFKRYSNDNCHQATKLYQNLAQEHGLSLVELSIGFINHQQFVTSTIIGATTLDQLEENIKAGQILLSDDLIKKINTIQEMIPNPAP
jgi:aryl-alcohol dehydrogenase-like predicted oxidoreductase